MLVIQLKKTDYNTKINETESKFIDHNHDRYITTPEFNKLLAENFAARLVQANLVTKTDFHNKLINLNKKINSNKTKHVLVENGLKNYRHLASQPTQRYFKTASNTNDHILSWKSKGLSDESIKSPSTSTNILNPLLDYVRTK